MFGTVKPHRLGLALGAQAIHLAEVHVRRGSARLERAATFVFPPEVGWDKPRELGERLRAFLQERKFAARQALAGLPGRWLLFHPQSLPPATPVVAAGILRLALEQQYQAEARVWACDYVGEISATERRAVLLAVLPQERLEQVRILAQAAGLDLRAVTSTLLSLTQEGPVADTATVEVLLHDTDDGVELAVRQGTRPVLLTHLPTAAPALLAGNICRILTQCPVLAGVAVERLILWHSGTTARERLEEVCRLLAIPGVEGLDQPAARWRKNAAAPTAALVAAAVARAGNSPPSFTLDFLHSKMTVPTAGWRSRPRLLALTAGAVAAAGLLWLGGDLYMQHRAVRRLETDLAAIKQPLAAAQMNLNRYNLARGWFDNRPPMLECLRALTQAFPTGGQVWATSLSMRDDLSGTLAGKAQDERGVLELLDRLRASGQFLDVKLLYLRQAERGSRVVSFALTFVHTGKE